MRSGISGPLQKLKDGPIQDRTGDLLCSTRCKTEIITTRPLDRYRLVVFEIEDVADGELRMSAFQKSFLLF
jgi:hypothetical protein